MLAAATDCQMKTSSFSSETLRNRICKIDGKQYQSERVNDKQSFPYSETHLLLDDFSVIYWLSLNSVEYYPCCFIDLHTSYHADGIMLKATSSRRLWSDALGSGSSWVSLLVLWWWLRCSQFDELTLFAVLSTSHSSTASLDVSSYTGSTVAGKARNVLTT